MAGAFAGSEGRSRGRCLGGLCWSRNRHWYWRWRRRWCTACEHLTVGFDHQVPERTAGKGQQHNRGCNKQRGERTDTAFDQRRGIGQNAIDPHGVGDVLDLLVAERLVAANKFVFDLLIDAARDEDLSRAGNSLEARGDVDAVAIDIARSRRSRPRG